MAKQTLQGTKKKKITHVGFLIRMRTTSGQRVIKRRKRKGRKRITVI